MEDLLIPREVRDALVKYLATRPWQEVQEVMPILIQLPPAPVKNDERGDGKAA